MVWWHQYLGRHPNCHHQILHTSFNLNTFYPLPYQRLIWDYKKADSEKIRKALDLVNWERLFSNKDINTQVPILNETILNVFSNHVRIKYITIDDKDPVWMNETIQVKIKAKDNKYVHKIYSTRKIWVLLETLITSLNELVSTTKALYYKNLGKKLNNPLLQAKTYWSILKYFITAKTFH